MGHWQDRLSSLVFYRDFAYPTHRRRIYNRMANNSNIGDVNATTFAELLSGPLVDIYVGETKRHWSLHRNLLCHHSEWLQAELSPTTSTNASSNSVTTLKSMKRLGKEEPDQRLDLPDDDPAGFELFVKWLYQGKLDDVSDIEDDQQKYDYAVACHKLHMLCDRFDMPQLKNIAIDQYRKGLSEAQLVPDSEEINQIYRSSPEGSPFRRLMVKIAARQIMDPDSEKDAENYRICFENNPSFAIDIVNAVKWGTGGVLFDDPTVGDECEYHDHDNGPNCHIKGKSKLGSATSAFAPD
ncbi:hypothetical protein K402DRAFT_388100 [Aulographum hederae CBS 113979]|uniref:BTB domain-containing protein n=1 Tax=Aulographum hederae CBS 113979 TaxID=1176131 RepID=A0A6G1HGT6_9PEZI|nr:hypothetical protein K402DRAFT_388100 [Aulographum hederae CBS 113979]